MKTRTALSATVLLMIIAGLAGVSYAFLSSLKPTPTAGRDLPRLDIANMEIGDIRYLDHGPSKGVATRYIIHKEADKAFHVFEIPMYDGVIRLPDLFWNVAWLPCEDFGVEPLVSDSEQTRVFRCRKGLEGSWWHDENVWALSGENIGVHGMTEPLESKRYVIQGSTLIIGKE